MLDIVLLVTALCIDSFIVAIAYGANTIRMPLKSILIIAGFGTFFLGISLYLAKFLQQFFSMDSCRYLSFIILFIIGVVSLFQTQMKHYLKKHKAGKLMFSVKEISFVVDIFIDETKADVDDSKVLSAQEAVYLAIALSIDSLATGLAFGMAVHDPREILLISFLTGIVLLFLGQWLGKRIAHVVTFDFSWISGILLILLAFCRLW